MGDTAALTRSEPARWEGAATQIAEQFAQMREAGLPRYLQLRSAVAELIRSGALGPGDQMPPEQYLASVLAISLGTVQKGLQSLTSQGLIVREHGKGTFVTEKRRSLTELKHFRFIDRATGDLLPVYARLIERSIVEETPELVELFGNRPDGYVRLTRLIDVDERFCCHSELYLPADRFAALMELPAEELESVNVKLVIAEVFNVTTDKLEESVAVSRPSREVAGLVGIGVKTTGMTIEAVGLSHQGVPYSFQRIFVPPSDYPLDISARR